MITIADVLAPENLKSAMEHLAGKMTSADIDHIQTFEFEEYWKINGADICEEIINGRYEPDLIMERESIDCNGRHSVTSQMSCTDRLFLRAFNQHLRACFEKDFYELNQAYLCWCDIETAVRTAAGYINQGKVWVVEIEMEHPFLKLDPVLRALSKKYIHCRAQKGGLISEADISPTMGHMYAAEVECHLYRQGYSVVRFLNNLSVFIESAQEAEKAVQEAERLFETMEIQAKNQVKKSQRENVEYHNWHPTALQKIDQNYYLINDGILTKKDCTLLFESEQGKKYLPVETTDSINVYSEVTFGADLFRFLAGKKMRVAFFDTYGNSIGSFYSSQYGTGGKTMLKQAAVYLDEWKRLQIAKKLETAAMHNIRANLRYYKKQKKSALLEETIQLFSGIIEEMDQASSLEQLMLIEARARQSYCKILPIRN